MTAPAASRFRFRRPRLLFRTAARCFALALLAAPGTGAATVVLQPGQEKLLLEMFASTGGCSLQGGQVAVATVTLDYDCPTGRLRLAATHVDSAGDLYTERLALSVLDGDPPAGFLEALAAQIRAREASLSWHQTAPARPEWLQRLLQPGPDDLWPLHVAVVVFPAATCVAGAALLVRTLARAVRRRGRGSE